jgi:hypothetical protein
MKTSNPYAPGMSVKTSPADSISSALSMGSGKAKAQYHKPQPINRSTGGGGGGMKHRASPGNDGQ